MREKKSPEVDQMREKKSLEVAQLREKKSPEVDQMKEMKMKEAIQMKKVVPDLGVDRMNRWIGPEVAQTSFLKFHMIVHKSWWLKLFIHFLHFLHNFKVVGIFTPICFIPLNFLFAL